MIHVWSKTGTFFTWLGWRRPLPGDPVDVPDAETCDECHQWRGDAPEECPGRGGRCNPNPGSPGSHRPSTRGQ